MTLKMEVQEEGLACGEEAQSKGHEALMEKKPSRHNCVAWVPLWCHYATGCHYLLPSDSGRKGYCWGESWGWELPSTVSCPQLTPTTHRAQCHPCPASSPAPMSLLMPWC